MKVTMELPLPPSWLQLTTDKITEIIQQLQGLSPKQSSKKRKEPEG